MSNAARSRFWLKSRWLLFLVNAILLVINLAGLGLLASGRRLADQNETALASKVASQLGMTLGYVKGPLTLYVDKGFPQTDAFKLYDVRQKLLMSGEDTDDDEHEQAIRMASIALGVDFDLSCYYSLDEGIHLHELRLSRKDEWLFDLNADGFYDQRALHRPTDPPDRLPAIQVWYKERWQDVTREGEWSKYRRQLRDGVVVNFDLQSGLWLSPTDKSPKGSRSNPDSE